MDILFATSNWAKILSARQILEPLGFNVEQIKMDIPELQLDEIEEVAKNSCKYASDKLKADRDVIKNSVKSYGQTLYYASEDLRDDDEIVKLAVSNKGLIVKYASFRLRDDKEIGEIAVKQNKEAYHFLSPRLKNDEDIKKLL